jgi:hypothetical protein
MRYDRFFGLLVVFIMLGSLLGIAANNIGGEPTDPSITGQTVAGKDGIEVNGFYFYENELQQSFDALVVNENGEATAVPFRTDPRNVSHINIDETAVDRIVNAQKIYLVFDPNTDDFEETKNNIQLALGEVSRLIVIVTSNNIYASSALTADIPNETYDDRIPIKSCEDATNTNTVLFFTLDEGDNVKMQGDCVIVSARTSEGLISTADKLGMWLMGLKV